MRNVMVDLETLGTVPGCSILSIGAVYFDEKGLGDEFYLAINRDSCMLAGLREDDDTLAWWQRQSPDARKVLDDAAKDTTPNLSLALKLFNTFLDKPGVRMWGNGADFDNAILRCAYAAVNLKPRLGAFNGRCYRTVKSMSELKIVREGTYHNALSDAKSQARHFVAILAEQPALCALL